jgi:four helix bundle protein
VEPVVTLDEWPVAGRDRPVERPRNEYPARVDLGWVADEKKPRRLPTGHHDDFKLGRNIANRLADFGAAVVQLSGRLPKDPTGRHIVIQMVRAATAAGANYEEARAAESRADFIHKAGIALKELRQARYWVDLVQRTGWMEGDLGAIVREANELAAMLGASVRTARARAAN